MWCRPWSPETIETLVSDTNPEGMLTNSDLELATLVLHEATLLEVCPEVVMAAPCSGSDNTPTMSWSTLQASTINQVVAYLLHIRALYSRQFPPTPWYSTTWDRIIAWRMTHIKFLN